MINTDSSQKMQVQSAQDISFCALCSEPFKKFKQEILETLKGNK